MASFGDLLTGLGNQFTRAKMTGNPLDFFTPAPKASDAMGPGTYSSPEATAQNKAQLQTAASAPVPGAPDAGLYAGGGGAGAYDPNTDPAMVGRARSQVSPMIATLNSLYDNLSSALPAFANDSRADIAGRYNPQYESADRSYKSAVDNTNQSFTARGTYDSSYRGNANDVNRGDHDTAVNTLNRNRDSELNDLGKFVAQEESAISNKPQYNLDDYTDVSSLLGLRDELDNHISSLRGAQTNLMTRPQLAQKLDATAPVTDMENTLKSRLDALNGSNAAPEAKYGIGAGYINSSSVKDKDKWTQYLATLLGPGTSKEA